MSPAMGTGDAPCHHGELLQGVFLDSTGRRCRGLVTLPMAGPTTYAEFTPSPTDELTVLPTDRTKALRAAELAVDECARLSQQPPYGGELRIRGDVPVGLGMGSSTSDILAAVRAVAASFGHELPVATIARLAVNAEQASDPLMLDHRPTLFAQREGRVLEHLGDTLPPTVVVSCLTGDGEPVDTLALSADDYSEDDVRTFERLRATLRRAIANADVGLLGHVTTESARHNQRILPKDEFDLIDEIATQAGAAGVQVAHSGNVAGLLFDPDTPELSHRLRRCVRTLNHNGIPVTRLFDTRHGRVENEDGRPHRGRDQPARPDPPRASFRVPAI